MLNSITSWGDGWQMCDCLKCLEVMGLSLLFSRFIKELLSILSCLPKYLKNRSKKRNYV